MSSKSYTKNSPITLFFAGFQQFTYHFNKNPTAAQRHCFQSSKPKLWLLFDQFLLDFENSHENCLTNLNLFQNQNWTIIAQTATILVCVIKFPRQNRAGRMTHCVIVFVGRIFILKITLPTAMADMT